MHKKIEMNNTITESGERLSFFKLFKDKNYRIVIPIIQRDYAQGREREREVRDTFLDALYIYLEENIPNRDLDFIYGTLNEVEGITNFIPLDGQQRLTTLFLLHWYLYQISDDVEKKELFKNSLIKDGKSLFTYETRSSSSEFCDALINAKIDFNNLLDSDDKVNNSLSKTVKNCQWYYLSWEYDPTIQAMLIMLDSIHNKFNGKKEFFSRLLDSENPIITFLFLNLKEYNLTDDLYIKMNSRGKPLTPFENFKAKFEQYLETIKSKRKFTLSLNGITKNDSLRTYFSHNIDTKWANLFWQYHKLQNRSDSKIDNTFDDELMNLIRVLFTYQYALKIDLSTKEKDNALEYLLGTQVGQKNTDYSEVISFNQYKKLNAISEEGVYFLIDVFDELANDNNKIRNYLSDGFKNYFNENLTFENALKLNFQSYHERLMFYAYIVFLLRNKDNRDGINQWMRVIHNLSHPDNTIIDSGTDFSRAIKSIWKLLPHSNNILEYLKGDPDIDAFSNWQVLEEKIKAHLILKDKAWEEKIEQTEQHGYFNGQIGFTLEFAGIVDYYLQNKNCDWTEGENKTYFHKFSDYADIASEIFVESYDNRKHNTNFVFERAVLTKGDYLTDASQERKNLLSTNLVKNNIKRDHSWKRLLRIVNDNEKEELWERRRNFVKQVLDDERIDVKNIEKSLELICQDRTGTWRDYFISCTSFFSYCNQGFIRFNNEFDILLYGQSQSNHMHVEMYTYYLWKKEIEPNKATYKPFANMYYKEIKSIEDFACIVFDKYIHERIRYKINIFYKYNFDSVYSYEIRFTKAKGENAPEKYGNDIKEIIKQCGFAWQENLDEPYIGYYFSCKNSPELIEKLKEITEKLNNI